jgi:hypothetical protein
MEAIYQAMRVNNVAIYWAAKPHCPVHIPGNTALYLTIQLRGHGYNYYILTEARIPLRQTISGDHQTSF